MNRQIDYHNFVPIMFLKFYVYYVPIEKKVKNPELFPRKSFFRCLVKPLFSYPPPILQFTVTTND